MTGPKSTLRLRLKKERAALSPFRREEASNALFLHLHSLKNALILSFASFGDEIDTSLLNFYLASSGRLALPKVIGNSLKVFLVHHLDTQLTQNSWGIWEPNPQLCTEVKYASLEIILVPALGFDSHHHRLGYGKGFYDRFLEQTPHAQTIGVGFREQLVSQIPVENSDIPLSKLCLF